MSNKLSFAVLVSAVTVLAGCSKGGSSGGGAAVAARAPITGTYSVVTTTQEDTCDGVLPGSMSTDTITIEIVGDDGVNGNVRLSIENGYVFAVGSYSEETGIVEITSSVMVTGLSQLLGDYQVTGSLEFAFETNADQMSFTGTVTEFAGPSCQTVSSLVGTMVLTGPPAEETLPLLVQTELLEGTPTFGSTDGHQSRYEPGCARPDTADFAAVFQAPAAGEYLFSCQPDGFFDSAIAAYSVFNDYAGSEIACTDGSMVQPCEIYITLAQGERIVVVVDGGFYADPMQTVSGSFQLTAQYIGIPAAIPACAIGPVSPGLAVATGYTFFGGNSFDGGCSGGSSGPDDAYSFVAPNDGFFTFDTNGSSYDTVIRLFTPDCTSEIICDDDSGMGSSSSVGLSMTAGQQVVVVIDAYFQLGGGDYVLNITL